MKVLSALFVSFPLVAAFAPAQISKTSSTKLEMKKEIGTFAVAASLLLSPISATAHEYNNNFIKSSSMQVSEAIKVLDMGLPSYGDISSPKASTESIKGVEPPKKEESPTGSSVVPTKKGGSALYPAKEKKAAKPSKKSVAVDAAPTKEEKEKKEDGVFYVDMSMPTYDNSSGGKKKSAFAL